MRYRAALLLAVSGLAGCLDAREQQCGDVLCAADQRCVEGAGCVDPGVVDVCAGRDPLAACSAGGITDGVCAPTTGGDLLCVPAGCGNGVTELDEVCDDGNRIDDDDCSANCLSTNACGNGITDVARGEGCDCGTDPLDLPDGCDGVNRDDVGATCDTSCALPGCGDGDIVVPEDCEAADLGGRTCGDLGYYGGTLGCQASCRFDVSACVGRCGDGEVTNGEACEPGVVVAATCDAFGFHDGTVGCNAACGLDLSGCSGQCGDGVRDGGETCDGDDFGGAAPSCTAFGFYDGAITCNVACGLELGGCTGRCGDDLLQAGEACEPDLGVGGATCADFGFDDGAVGCNASCGFDFAACTVNCGDGVLQPGEQCEAGLLDGKSCLDFGYYGGALGCNAACGFDLGGCSGTCGDGILVPAEEDCEVGDLGGATCNDLGYYGGTLACGGGCRFDDDGCVGRCGDGTVDPAEQCDGSAPPYGCADFGGVIDRPTCSIGCSADVLSCDASRLVTEQASIGERILETRRAPDDGSYWSVMDLGGPPAVNRMDPDGTVTHYYLQDVGPFDAIVELEVVSSKDVYAIDCMGRIMRWHEGVMQRFMEGLVPEHPCVGDVGLLAIPTGPTQLVLVSGGTNPAWLLRSDDQLLDQTDLPPDVVDFAYCGGTYAWAATEGGEVFQSGDALQWTLTTGVPGTWRNLTCEHSTPPGGDVLWFTGDDAESVRLDIDTMTMRAYPMELELPRPWLLEPQPGLLIAGGSPLVWHGRGWVRLGARLYGSVLPMGAGPSDDGVVQLVDDSARVRRAELLVLNYGAAGSMAPVAGGLWRTQDTVLLRDSDHVDVVELDSRVWAATNEEAFVTSGGKIRRCTPAGCAAPTIVSGNEILTVDVTPSGEAYAADAADELFRWTGAAWIATGRRVGSPKVVAPGEVIGVHGSDVLRYAAVNNQVTTLASAPQPLVAVGGHWPDAFFAVGHEGTVLRYEPGSGAWLPELHDLTTEVLRTVAVGGGRILVLGDGDTLLQLDSTGWMRADLGAADVNLTDLRITDDASLWVLGQGGASELIVPAP